MKKIIFILIIITVLGLNYIKADATNMFDFKVCLFHDEPYNMVLNELQCPLRYNKPPPGDPLSKGEPWANLAKTYVIHSPDCYGTLPGYL